MKYLKDFVINTFATIGIVNTVVYIKNVLEDIYEAHREKSDISKRIDELDNKIKYVERVNSRIEDIQYTLSELRSILSKRTYEETLYDLKSANSEFTN